jgi:hypothetical protein
MLFTSKNNIVFLIVVFLNFVSCSKNEEFIPVASLQDAINLNHFNYLYKEIEFQGKETGIIHIYSEFPNYEYAIEPNEGFTCVDDVARAIVMLSKYIEVFGNDEVVLNKIYKLTEFVLQMQNENGYFNNFIRNDFSINTTYKTSVAELNWWSFRALWGLEYAYPLLKSNTDISSRIEQASQKLMVNIKRDLPIIGLSTEFINAIELPTWLPQKYASDQSSVLILGLLKNYERTVDGDAKLLIDALAKGVMVMQKGNADNYPYGAFLSWENMWHAWGNNQAYTLLKVGQKFNNQEYIDSALLEIDNFYPKMLNKGFAEAFWIKKSGDNYVEIDLKKYPQIAYGLRPMIWAASEAYQYSNNENYLLLAKNLEVWLNGKNDASIAIYNPATGISFDGVLGPNEVNRNSGAESTIESLFILLEMKKLKK